MKIIQSKSATELTRETQTKVSKYFSGLQPKKGCTAEFARFDRKIHELDKEITHMCILGDGVRKEELLVEFAQVRAQLVRMSK